MCVSKLTPGGSTGVNKCTDYTTKSSGKSLHEKMCLYITKNEETKRKNATNRGACL